MTRVEFTAAAIGSIVLRATDAGGRVRCERCFAKCPTRADYEIDHAVAEGVQPSGERPPLTAADGKLLCLKCHDKKTRRDVFEIARSKRIRDRHRVVGQGPTEIARRFSVDQEPEK